MSGMKIGVVGKKYGLVLPASKKAAASRPKPSLSFFTDEDEGDEKTVMAKSIQKQQEKIAKQAEKDYTEALEQDANAFEYDTVYDQMQEDREAQARLRAQPKEQQRKPKYIAGLMAAAKLREREEQLVLDRKLQKEAREEKQNFVDKDKYVTSAYKERLKNLKRWKEEDRLQEEHESKVAPSSTGHMLGFYSNLLSDNVALGSGSTSEAFGPTEEELKKQEEEEQAQAAREAEARAIAAEKETGRIAAEEKARAEKRAQAAERKRQREAEEERRKQADMAKRERNVDVLRARFAERKKQRTGAGPQPPSASDDASK